MKDQDKGSKEKLSQLRRRTELAAAEKSSGISDISGLSPEKVQRLIHELQVHQMELETQNEELRRTRQELETSRDKYSELYEFASSGYFVLDQNGVILEANLTGCGLLGKARVFLTGKPLASFVNEQDRNDLYLHFRQVLETRSEQTCDIRLTKKDGSQIRVRLDSHVIGSQDGSPTVLRTAVTDITEGKRDEEALYDAESRYRRLFESARDGILILDLDTGKILDVNQYLIDLLGYSHEAFLEKCLWEVSPFQDTALNKEAFAELQQKGFIRYENLPLETSDGRSIDVEFVSNSYLINGTTFIQCNIRDITERKRTEEALKERDKQYRTLFEESIDGVYSVLRDGRIADANPSFCELFGYSREEMIGKDILELLFDPGDRSKLQEEIETRGFVKDYEVKFRKRGGTEFDCLLTSSVYLGQDGSIAGYRGILRDLTVRKGLQRQLFQAQKMESIGTLAGGIAHDFNNLLTVVLGFSDLLLIGRDERDPSYADIQRINQAARNGAELVKRILMFSRKAEINSRPLNLNHEIEQAKKLLTRTIPKMIKIELILSDDLGTVNADPTQVEQILMNLAVNARDAMPDGGKLTFETKCVNLDEEYCELHVGPKPGDYVMLSASDTGHGMAHETLNRIFEPFYTTKETGKGTGLGLAMVYGIVKQHGGHITCYSEPGMGTTFKIYLPVIRTDAKSEAPTEKPLLPRGTETILLVDDEEMIRELGKRILERSGYTVLTAVNGMEALDLYKKSRDKIFLVILDLIMPEMGGKECLEELLKIDPQVKALIASGYSEGGETKKNIKTGASGFVGKPYNIRKMLQAVRQVLDQD